MPVEPKEGVVLAGRFRLDRRLGRGGMGDVWAATNTVTLRKVAIKFLHGEHADEPNVRRRFLREARAASAVSHPNVVEILDVLELEDAIPAMVMELLEGESLGQRLRREHIIPLADLAPLLLPAVAAIGSAHAAGVVHRDLKPDNIFVSRGHDDAVVVKVLDFGIAKIAGESEGGATNGLTGTGAMLGTPYYMAPEQLFTDETIDYRCDIWALGVILYECLSGSRPAKGDNFADIVKVIATRAIVPLERVAPEVPLEITSLVSRMLSFDKDRRPQSLREVRDVLQHHTSVLVTSFGDPVLKPIRQGGMDPDASGGLRKSDVELLLADEGMVTQEALGAPTLEDPAGPPLDTQSRLGLGITLSGRAGAPRASAGARDGKRGSKRAVLLGLVAAVAVVGLAGQAVMRARTPDASARTGVPLVQEVATVVTGTSVVPPPVASSATAAVETTAVTAPSAPATTTPTARTAPSQGSGNKARAGSRSPSVAGAGVGNAAQGTTAVATPPAAPTATTGSTTATGGLVEKPPF